MRRLKGQILRSTKLRSTESRSTILGLFLDKSHALSYSEIEKEVSSSFDRVTVYRTLKTFLDKGIIHKILDDGGSLRYGLCRELCSSSDHHHNHVHFKCTSCGHTNCLDEVEIPYVRLPSGYQVAEMNLLMQGLCNNCQ